MNIAAFGYAGIGASGPATDVAVIATASEIAQAGVPFLWLGSALAISFLEINLSLRLGICQAAFRALSICEIALASVLAIAVFADADRSGTSAGLVVALWIVLGAQVVLLRPRLDAGTSRLLARAGASRPMVGDTASQARLRSAYMDLEIIKIVGLAVLGCLLVSGAAG